MAASSERRRTHIARVLAKQPTEPLTGEPTNHPDVQHQLDLPELVTGLPAITAVTLHDLSPAAGFYELVVLSRGVVVAAGPQPPASGAGHWRRSTGVP